MHGRTGTAHVDTSFLQLGVFLRIAIALERIADQFEKGSDELDVRKAHRTGMRYPE